MGLVRREPAGPDVVEQVGVAQGAVLWRLQRPNVKRDWRSAGRRYDAIDEELGGRHVAVLRGRRQHRLEHRFDALGRERVEAASIRRWAARDGAGQHMMARVKDLSKKDDKTFVIALREPYGLIFETMAKTATPILYIMRKKEAETDPNQQITEYIGSGPFTYNRNETQKGQRYVYDRFAGYVSRSEPATGMAGAKQVGPFTYNRNETQKGQRYVYDRFAGYVSRSEPATGMAGAKQVKVDRVIYENMPDSQTALQALKAGEIDFFEIPPIDLLDTLESDPNIKVSRCSTRPATTASCGSTSCTRRSTSPKRVRPCST